MFRPPGFVDLVKQYRAETGGGLAEAVRVVSREQIKNRLANIRQRTGTQDKVDLIDILDDVVHTAYRENFLVKRVEDIEITVKSLEEKLDQFTWGPTSQETSEPKSVWTDKPVMLYRGNEYHATGKYDNKAIAWSDYNVYDVVDVTGKRKSLVLLKNFFDGL